MVNKRIVYKGFCFDRVRDTYFNGWQLADIKKEANKSEYNEALNWMKEIFKMPVYNRIVVKEFNPMFNN